MFIDKADNFQLLNQTDIIRCVATDAVVKLRLNAVRSVQSMVRFDKPMYGRMGLGLPSTLWREWVSTAPATLFLRLFL